MVRTLNELSQLKDNRFGQPDPRHGLRLLWWFANDCVYIDGNGRMTALCNPANGDFGFRPFHNRIDDEDRLLPNNINLTYFEVGNLKYSGLLPSYVTKNYNKNCADSNKDRIIVRIINSDLRSFDRIYVTQHADQVTFDQNHTYRISQGLIKTIKGFWNLEEFLGQTKSASFQPQSYLQAQYAYQPMETRSIIQPNPYQYQPPYRNYDSTCLYIFLLICVVIGFLFLLFLAANFKR